MRCLFGQLILHVCLVTALVSSSSAPSLKNTALVLDVDNTLYQESTAGIEAQIVQNTHTYCKEHLGLDKEQADDFFRAYGSTIEGLKQSLWKDLPDRQEKLAHFYQEVYKDIDMSKLLPTAVRLGKSASSTTGYSRHTQQELGLLRRLLRASPQPILYASNSPSWHVQKVLQAMGLVDDQTSSKDNDMSMYYTPDRTPEYPTKHTPAAFFGTLPYDRMVVLEDSQHNLDSICGEFSNAEGVLVSENEKCTIVDALMQTFGLVNPEFDFDSIRYLESKNVVDRRSIHKETWNQVIDHLQSLDEKKLVIVDVGAGLLSMLQLFLAGDTDNGLRPLFEGKGKDAKLLYTAYESNRDLLEACEGRLLEWGFKLKEKVAEDEFLFVHPQVEFRLILKDFDDDDGPLEAPPHLIVGCCFADLLDPYQLASSLIRRFELLDRYTLLYFPITFCGTTQFLPPRPFEHTDEELPDIPSDTLAFGLYSKALSEGMGHNLNPLLLKQAMNDHGASLLKQGNSNWKIEPDVHPYLFETMLYFFGTAGGPQLMNEGWDAGGWLRRARENRPTILVSNVDLLFSLGKKGGGEEGICSGDSPTMLDEIQFIAPQKVTTIQKEIPELGPNQVLVESSCSLISSGTELKIFKGSFGDAALDVNIKGMAEERMSYPLAFGYSLVGRIVACGSDVSKDFLGKMVFTFSAHATYVIADVGNVQVVPEGIAAEDAIFMPSVETALSLVHDAHVRVGENVAVYGQGLIGLLVTSLLSMHNKKPTSGRFGTITVFDTLSDRLAAASQMGASQALLPGGCTGPFDVSIEISGNARALQSAIDCTSNGGRVIVGSWYGNTDVQLKLGIDFHRSHKTIQTSQVSEIPASLLGLWDKPRRFALTWELVQQIRPSRLLTKTTSLDKAQEAYKALDTGTEIAVAFDYQNASRGNK